MPRPVPLARSVRPASHGDGAAAALCCAWLPVLGAGIPGADDGVKCVRRDFLLLKKRPDYSPWIRLVRTYLSFDEIFRGMNGYKLIAKILMSWLKDSQQASYVVAIRHTMCT